MPVTVVLDHPHRHVARCLWRRVSGSAGAILLVIGLTASIAAVPTSIVVVGLLVGWVAADDTDPEPWPPDDLPVREILFVWAVSTPIAIAGMKGGLRLARGGRTLLLFLRRFGHDDARSAVTFAVLETIGASWRIVTLDGAEMAPIGVSEGTRPLFRAGHFTSTHILAFAPLRRDEDVSDPDDGDVGGGGARTAWPGNRVRAHRHAELGAVGRRDPCLHDGPAWPEALRQGLARTAPLATFWMRRSGPLPLTTDHDSPSTIQPCTSHRVSSTSSCRPSTR